MFFAYSTWFFGGSKVSSAVAKDLKYIDEVMYKEISALADEVGKMLNGLINKLI